MLDELRYRRPLETLITKHLESYRAHLSAVLAAKEAEAGHLASEIATIERERILTVEPALRRAREDLAAIGRKVDRARAEREREEEYERLTWQVAELQHEVADLRASWSWRISAPLRRVYALLRGRP
jgi:hypothetical protein